MPTCPGCERNVPYRRLDTHEEYCDGLVPEDDGASAEELDRRLLEMEQLLNEKLREVESRAQRELVDQAGSRNRSGRTDRYRR